MEKERKANKRELHLIESVIKSKAEGKNTQEVELLRADNQSRERRWKSCV